MDIETIEQLNKRVSGHWVLGERTDTEKLKNSVSWFFVYNVIDIQTMDYSRLYDEYVIANCEYAAEIYERDNYVVSFKPYQPMSPGPIIPKTGLLKLEVNPLYVRTNDELGRYWSDRMVEVIKWYTDALETVRACKHNVIQSTHRTSTV